MRVFHDHTYSPYALVIQPDGTHLEAMFVRELGKIVEGFSRIAPEDVMELVADPEALMEAIDNSALRRPDAAMPVAVQSSSCNGERDDEDVVIDSVGPDPIVFPHPDGSGDLGQGSDKEYP